MLLLALSLFVFSPSCYSLDNFTEILIGRSTETINTLQITGKPEVFKININECRYKTIFRSSSLRGVIHGRVGGHNHSRSVPDCVWSVEVPTGYTVSSYVVFLLDPCFIDITVTAISNSTSCPKVTYRCTDVKRRRAMAVGDLNQQTFYFHDSLQSASLPLEFQVHFDAVEKSVLYTLPIVFTSENSGYVTSHGFEDGKQYPCGTNATRHISAPDGHVIMISFLLVNLEVMEEFYVPGRITRALYKINKAGLLVLLKRQDIIEKSPTIIETNVLLHLNEKSYYGIASKMLFTFHLSSHAPRRLDNGLWDCSVPYYNTFKEHLECNLVTECQGGEDEGAHCPFSSPACNGSIAVDRKCYVYIEKSEAPQLSFLNDECKKLGGNIASMKSKKEWEAFLEVFKYGKNYIIFIGLKTSNTNWPKYYRYTFKWDDNTIAYESNISRVYNMEFSRNVCGYYYYFYPLFTLMDECPSIKVNGVVCEYNPHLEWHFNQTLKKISNIEISTIWNKTNVLITYCPLGHVTHLFLLCDPKSACGTTGLSLYCQTTSGSDTLVKTQMFECNDHLTTLPYSLVCNFKTDCLDGSDENFCEHEYKCKEFTCRNGQCIPYNNFCDSYTDCWDGSDEECNYLYFNRIQNIRRIFGPAIVHFDGAGDFYQVPLSPSEPCPQTHFRCAGESAYCLPVYVRCNGVYDCPSHEDEDDCLLYTCPGFYRCRASSVCVHADNVCDGWPQCPQHDDEAFCGLNCPSECFCLGLVFVCNRTFLSHMFPELRYLDGANSGMTLNNFSSNFYLVWISLAFCGLASVSSVHLPNLQTLDLSDNNIITLDFTSVALLNNLKELRLAGNPLFNLLNSGFPYLHKNLDTIDVSRSLLIIFDSKTFQNFSNVEVLNISFSRIETITDNGFTYLIKLTKLDLRNNPLQIFPREVLKPARYLRTVYSDNYKICCQRNVPDSLKTGSCVAPVDEISSCDDLLRSDVYRVFLWLFCVLSITGNSVSFLFRQLLQRKASVLGFSVFITNLSIADFLMGVYLAILGVADETYRSIYLWHDLQWRDSTTCKVAGFLSFMSSEVSALIICLITIDRFIVLRFPFSKFRFERWSASWACGLAWAVGFTLAAVPLLPCFSDWEFYSQNAICIPLPITRKSFRGRSYSLGIMIIFNMILFVVIAVGQICIYLSVRMNSMKGNTTKKLNDIIIARRLTTVVVSDFLCWFPVGMVSILATLGIPVPSEAGVALVIFVLPLNSALNPFLYTFNLLLEKWNRVEEQRILKQLELSLNLHNNY